MLEHGELSDDNFETFLAEEARRAASDREAAVRLFETVCAVNLYRESVGRDERVHLPLSLELVVLDRAKNGRGKGRGASRLGYRTWLQKALLIDMLRRHESKLRTVNGLSATSAQGRVVKLGEWLSKRWGLKNGKGYTEETLKRLIARRTGSDV
jgi:hypothetical protein